MEEPVLNHEEVWKVVCDFFMIKREGEFDSVQEKLKTILDNMELFGKAVKKAESVSYGKSLFVMGESGLADVKKVIIIKENNIRVVELDD